MAEPATFHSLGVRWPVRSGANAVAVGHNGFYFVIQRDRLEVVSTGITAINVGHDESRGFVTDGLIQGPARWPRSLDIRDICGLIVTGTKHVSECFPAAGADLRLDPAPKAVEAGVVLPNINDGHTGKAPDLGCCELGVPLPHYGPRP